jgi:hypothetical protein
MELNIEPILKHTSVEFKRNMIFHAQDCSIKKTDWIKYLQQNKLQQSFSLVLVDYSRLVNFVVPKEVNIWDIIHKFQYVQTSLWKSDPVVILICLYTDIYIYIYMYIYIYWLIQESISNRSAPKSVNITAKTYQTLGQGTKTILS